MSAWLSPAGWRLVDEQGVPPEWAESFGEQYVLTPREFRLKGKELQTRVIALNMNPDPDPSELMWAELELATWGQAEERNQRGDRPTKYV